MSPEDSSCDGAAVAPIIREIIAAINRAKLTGRIEERRACVNRLRVFAVAAYGRFAANLKDAADRLENEGIAL